MVETIFKKIQRPVRNFYYRFNYFLFKLFRLFKKPKKINLKSIKRILLIELTVIGDLLVITPSLKALKQICPNAKIDVLMFDKFKAILEDNPNVNEVVGINGEPSVFRLKEFLDLNKRLMKNKYDLGIILHHGSFSNSLLLSISGIKTRVGCTKAGLLKGKGFFLTHKVMPHLGHQHVVKQNLDVISLLSSLKTNPEKLRLEMFFPKKDESWAADFLKKNKISKRKPIVAIHTGTRHPSHEWFNDRFKEIADWLVDEFKAQIIFTGDKYDYEHFVKKIQKKMKHKSVYAKTSLKQCAALLGCCDLLFSVDTSMVHIGAASGVPVLGLYGSGKPASWKPWGRKNKVIFNEDVGCTSCRKTECTRDDFICMNSITVDQVKREIKHMLVSK